MFRSILRVFFVLICASGATVAMAVNEKSDIDIPIDTTCRVREPNGMTNTIRAENCATFASRVCYGNNGDGFASVCVIGCNTCNPDSTPKYADGTAEETTSDWYRELCSFKYKTCEKTPCNKTCAIGLPRWRPVVNTNYQAQTSATLDKAKCECVTHTIYRCNAGYYMNGPNAVVSDTKKVNCVRCPPALDKGTLSYGTSEAGYNAGISSCYTDKGDSYSHKVQEGIKTNTIGKYRLSADCYYNQPAN